MGEVLNHEHSFLFTYQKEKVIASMSPKNYIFEYIYLWPQKPKVATIFDIKTAFQVRREIPGIGDGNETMLISFL